MTSPTAIPDGDVSHPDPSKRRVRLLKNAIADLKAALRLAIENDTEATLFIQIAKVAVTEAEKAT